MLASMAERKQYRGNHAANLILFYQYSMQKSKMLHLKGRIFEVTMILLSRNYYLLRLKCFLSLFNIDSC